MNNRPRTCRFTLMELLVAALAAAILALTAGLMLLYGYGVWRRSQDRACMQEDGAAALATLAHMLRQASAAPTPPAGILRVQINTSPSQIAVWRGATQEAVVFARGNDLIYSRMGQEVALVSRRLVPGSFLLTPLPSAASPDEVVIQMILTTTDGGTTPVATVLSFRN